MRPTKVSGWLRQRRYGRVIAWLLCSAILVTGTTYAYLTDGGVHVPPTGGTYDYNAFKPGAVGFPAVGGTYTDPVFGGVIKRLTNNEGRLNDDDNYSFHYANANGTLSFYEDSNAPGLTIIAIATGNPIYTNQPVGSQRTEISWDPLDPDKYYYFSGASLVRRSLAAQSNTTIKTFPATLQFNGGSLNKQSRDGRYWTLRWSGTNKVWDSQMDVIYTGQVTPLSSGGWVAITPDGKFIVNAAGNAGTPNTQHHSYPINHAGQSIDGTSPTQFWGLCGAHADLISASDGKNYYIGVNCHDDPSVWRVDITLNQANRSSSQQMASNQKLVQLDWNDDVHMSAVSRGPLSDWIFIDTEAVANDPFNGSTSNWYPYKQEILAVNVITREIRRLAHHRSRGISANYYYQPRVSSSWDGSVVLWTSNYNVSSPAGYSDLYAIQNPIGLAAPQNLRFK